MIGTGPVLYIGGNYFSHLDIPGDEGYTPGMKELDPKEAYLLFDGKAQRFRMV